MPFQTFPISQNLMFLCSLDYSTNYASPRQRCHFAWLRFLNLITIVLHHLYPALHLLSLIVRLLYWNQSNRYPTIRYVFFCGVDRLLSKVFSSSKRSSVVRVRNFTLDNGILDFLVL